MTVIKKSRHGTGLDRYFYNDYSQQRLVERNYVKPTNSCLTSSILQVT
jgi:hypothetical protein